MQLAVADLKLRDQIGRKRHILSHPVIEADSAEHGVVLLCAGVMQVARVYVWREITNS